MADRSACPAVAALRQAPVPAPFQARSAGLGRRGPGNPAWKKKPSWYQVSTSDRMIHPDTERRLAERMNPRSTIELDASHASLASRHQRDRRPDRPGRNRAHLALAWPGLRQAMIRNMRGTICAVRAYPRCIPPVNCMIRQMAPVASGAVCAADRCATGSTARASHGQ
jgi:hypothetical protein